MNIASLLLKMICNINYVGRLIGDMSNTTNLPFRCDSPQMYIKKCPHFTFILFKRLIGCKSPILSKVLNISSNNLSINIIRMQSATACINVGCNLHLGKLGNFCHYNSISYLFEPELFPALRLTSFDPLCINIFASGKCMILGLRHLCFQKYVKQIEHLINRSGCKQQLNNAAD